jgi:predicted short-subunit dehydrogenase-like oxidoreductase (DUF2520 family)
MGQALGRLLLDRGEPVIAVASRRLERSEAAARFIGGATAVPYSRLPELAARLLIAVSDDALTLVADVLAGAGMKRGVAVHTSGAQGPEALAPLAAAGVSCATLHPLQTIASPEQGVSALPGVAFAITGDGPAAEWAAHIATLLSGEVLRIPSERLPLYHAAAVMASNYVVGLIDAAAMLLEAAGVERHQALRAIRPLVEASAGNALTLGPVNALTGPIERGDVRTVAAHWKVLAATPEAVREFYRGAGLYVIELARRRGLSEADTRKLRELLRESGT